MKPTIYDIARAAGVSIATVSKVLNDKGRIGATTRQNVLRMIRELGYERNTIASALAGKNTFSIGLLLPDVNNPFFSELVRGAEDAAFQSNYSLLICNTDHNPDKERTYLRTLRMKAMDGVIIATGTVDAAAVQELMEDGIEVVLLSRPIPGLDVPLVSVDNFRGGYLAASHLLELGHRNIGIATEPLYIGSATERLKGFQRAVADFGPVAVKLHVFEGKGFGMTTGGRLTGQLFEQHPEITAVFAGNDEMAVGALQACKESGRRVPDEVSIVGFDDTILSRIVEPPLTTVAQPIYQLGQATAAVMIERIENGDGKQQQVVLTPQLVIRQSTAVAQHNL